MSRIIIVLFLFLTIFLFFSCTNGNNSAALNSNYTWEYRIERFSSDKADEFQTRLNQIGNQEWEYAGPICSDGNGTQYIIFKKKEIKPELKLPELNSNNRYGNK